MFTITLRYAKALLSLSKDNPEITENITVINEVLSNNKKMANLLNSPLARKKAIQLLTEKMHAYIANFCKLLLQNNRLSLLQDITTQFLQLLKEEKGEVDITITSAVALTKKEIKKIATTINKEQEPNVINHIDKSILGGIVIRRGYNVMDLSVMQKIEQLRKISMQGVL